MPKSQHEVFKKRFGCYDLGMSSRNQDALWDLLVLPAVLIGVGVLLLTQKSQAANMLPLTGPNPLARPTTTPNTTATTTDLVTRLSTSQLSRAIYNFQALLYEYGYTNAVPDGVDGPVTRSLTDQVDRDTQGITGTPLEKAHFAVLVRFGVNAQPIRTVPDVLPVSVINQLNADARLLDPNAVLIQANA